MTRFISFLLLFWTSCAFASVTQTSEPAGEESGMIGAVLFNRSGKVLRTDVGALPDEAATGPLFLTEVTFLPPAPAGETQGRIYLKIYSSANRSELLGESENAQTWDNDAPKVYGFSGIKLAPRRDYLLAFESERGFAQPIKEVPLKLIKRPGGGAVALRENCAIRLPDDANVGITLAFETEPPQKSAPGILIGSLVGLFTLAATVIGILAVKKRAVPSLPPPPGA